MDSLRRLAFTPLLVGIHAAHLVVLQVSAITARTSRITTASTSRKAQKCPRHVAFSIVTSLGRKAASSRAAENGDRPIDSSRRARSRKGKEKAEDIQRTADEDLILETVRQVVAWALQNGVDEISLWNEDGLLEMVLPGLLSILVPSPPTPPASGTCSPPRYSHDVPPTTSGASSSTANGSSMGDSEQSFRRQETQSYTVWPDMEEMLKDAQIGQKLRLKPLSVHILPSRTSEDLLADMTKDLVAKDITLEEITIEHVDDMIRDALHFHSDPELLVVHHMPGSAKVRPSDVDRNQSSNTARGWRHKALASLFPRHPLEIHGYPFWMLRITEIYDSRPKRIMASTDEWDQAMRRWLGVEQRLGR